MADNRILTGPLEQEPTPLFLPVEDRLGLLHRVLADVRLGAWDRRIIHWLASSTDTSTLLTILSLLKRAKAAELSAERYKQHDGYGGCPSCTCCTREGCHRGVDSECPYSTVLERVVCPLHRGLTREPNLRCLRRALGDDQVLEVTDQAGDQLEQLDQSPGSA